MLNEFGLRAIDGRSSLGVALRQFRAAIVDDLGGDAAISAQRKALLDIVVRERLMLDSLDAFILDQPSLVDRRRRALLPVVRERAAIANSFVAHLQALGLDRVEAPPPSLSQFLQARQTSESASGPSSGQNASQAGSQAQRGPS